MSPLGDRLIELIEDDNDIHEHLQTLRNLVVRENAQTVVELGTAMGRSATAFLAGLEQTGGHLWTVDIERNPELFDWVEDHPQVTRIIGNDLEVVEILPRPCDLLFIDSAHDYDHTSAELRAFVSSVRPKGWVLLHDTSLCWSVRDAIADFIEVPTTPMLDGDGNLMAGYVSEEPPKPFGSMEWRFNCNGLFLGQMP